MKYLVEEYATVTRLYTCEVEADNENDAVEKAIDEGDWKLDESYDSWGDESEWDVKEINEEE